MFIVCLGLTGFIACEAEVLPTIGVATFEPTEVAAEPTAIAATATLVKPTATSLPPTETPIPPTATVTPIPPTETPAPLSELSQETTAAWEAFVGDIAADKENAQTRVDALWDQLVAEGRVPLILDDAAIFLYRGDAQRVRWLGDFSYWQFGAGLEGKRVGDTDLWYAVANFPRDSRAEYQILLNERRWITDPANPLKQKDGGDENSVLIMPDFQVSDYTQPDPDIEHGNLSDWKSLQSKAWGGPIQYRVYTPPDVDSYVKLPVVYVTDGSDFSDEGMGATQIVLDNLIASQAISPTMAVFIDARDANNLEDNQRELQFLARPEDFARFIIEDLVPLIDEAYPTDATRDGRVLMGTSYGGVFSTYLGLAHPEIFGKLAIYSPAYWVFGNPNGTGNANFAAGVRRMDAVVDKALAVKSAEGTAHKIFLSMGYPPWDVGDMSYMAKAFRDRGDQAELFKAQEGHSWGAWSTLTDEMLEYFFGL